MTDLLISWTRSTALRLLAIVAAAFLFRAALLSLAHNPGLHDPIHYFNLGRRLAEGQGFTIDYVWHYSRIPPDISHGIDHWMPLAGVAAALGIALGGASPLAAVVAFVVAGAAVPLLTFLAAKQLELADDSALIAALLAAFIPDLVLSSLRTDTTALNAVFICVAILLLNDGLQHSRRVSFILCGALAGLAYLTRNDSLLFFPMLVAAILIRMWVGARRLPYRVAFIALCLTIASFLVVIAPWLWRNLQETGLPGTAETSRMFFMVEQTDHYAYGTAITWESMLQRRSLGELLYFRLFQFAAAIKQILVSLAFPLNILILAGAIRLMRNRPPARLLMLAPAALWLLGILFVYPFLLPLKSQAGSFEKALLTVVPLLIPPAAIALDAVFKRFAWKMAFLGITVLWLAVSSIVQVRRVTEFADTYYGSIQVMLDELATLPDVTGDGEIRLMSQDPYVMSYFGYASVMTPLASREGTLELGRRFGIDYLMMPASRPALDALYLSEESDPRFVLAAHIADAGAIPFELYRLVYDVE